MWIFGTGFQTDEGRSSSKSKVRQGGLIHMLGCQLALGLILTLPFAGWIVLSQEHLPACETTLFTPQASSEDKCHHTQERTVLGVSMG